MKLCIVYTGTCLFSKVLLCALWSGHDWRLLITTLLCARSFQLTLPLV